MANGVEMNRRFDKVDKRLDSLEANVKIIKKVVTNQSKQPNNHEKRIVALEKVVHV
jgi:hypothetical protein